MRFSAGQWTLALAAAALVHALLALGLLLLRPPASLFASAGAGAVVSLATTVEAPVTTPTQAPAPIQPAAPLRTPVQTVTPQVTTPQTATSVQPPQAAAPVEQALPSFPQSSAAGVPVAPASAQAIAPQVIKALSVGATTQATILPPAAHTAMQPATMQARTPSGPSGATTSPDSSYIGQLRSWLGRHKQYPPKARQQGLQGTVRLYFVVDRQGRVLESRILQGSGHPALDQAALRMLKQAAPLPAMPDSLLRNRLELILPVQFHLTKPPAASAQNKPQ